MRALNVLLCLLMLGGSCCEKVQAQIQTDPTKTNLLFEHFSNENYFNIDNIDHSLYQKLSGLGQHATLIQYQTYYGGYDADWAANDSECDARTLFYGISYSNQFRQNGIVSGTTAALDTAGLDTIVQQLPAFQLKLSNFQRSGNSLQIEAALLALDTLPWADYTVYAAIIEREVPTSSGGFYRQHVFRKMLPNIGGDTYARAWMPGDSIEVAYNWTIENYVGDPNNLGLVLFIQNYSTKRVYQSLSTFQTVVPSQFNPKALIRGQLYHDANANCANDSEAALGGWMVKLQNGNDVRYAWADAMTGQFSLAVPSGTYQLECLAPNAYWQTCPTAQMLTVGSGDTVSVDMAAQALWTSPELSVDLSTPLLRPCNSNRYWLRYANTGSAPAPNAYIDLEVDDAFVLSTAGTNWQSLGGQRYRLPLGTLDVGARGRIALNAFLDCAVTLGATHCWNASISCDSSALQPWADPLWDDSDIEVSVQCTGDSVRLELKNRGTGTPQQPLDYFITEDEIMLRTGNTQLPPNGTTTITLPAYSATYHIHSKQPDHHPYGPFTAAAIEGCGMQSYTTGQLLQYPLDDNRGFQDVHCQANRNGLISNEVLAFPVGYGPQHFIDRETPLEYVVHFQNRGNSEAQTIVAEVRLPDALDIERLELGASSHPFRLEIIGEQTLFFIVENAALPSYLDDEMASHGFVQFRIFPKTGLLNGANIELSSLLYFNANPPIRTSEAFHQIGERFIRTQFESEYMQVRDYGVRIFPNPFRESVTIQIEQPETYSMILFRLFDRMGRELRRDVLSSSTLLQFQRDELGQGVYLYRIEGDGKLLDAGKLRVE